MYLEFLVTHHYVPLLGKSWTRNICLITLRLRTYVLYVSVNLDIWIIGDIQGGPHFSCDRDGEV
jgi:hypothetical protein